MALIAHLYVNDTPIGWVAARRTTRGLLGVTPEPDEVHTYEVAAQVDGVVKHATVTHRYGDGALALIAKAAELVKK